MAIVLQVDFQLLGNQLPSPILVLKLLCNYLRNTRFQLFHFFLTSSKGSKDQLRILVFRKEMQDLIERLVLYPLLKVQLIVESDSFESDSFLAPSAYQKAINGETSLLDLERHTEQSAGVLSVDQNKVHLIQQTCQLR